MWTRLPSLALAALLLVPAAPAAGLHGQTLVPVGWPVWPVDQQHPIRGGFLDPRPSPSGPIYHTGVDISVDDGHPEPGHPPGHSHRVYALEGGVVSLPASDYVSRCARRSLRVGRFGYGHVDPVGVVVDGELVRPGQLIGWTCTGEWHLHLSEFALVDGQQVYVNPLRAGALRPYVDTVPPTIHEIGFFTPTTPRWLLARQALVSLPEGGQVSPGALHGLVDVSAWIDDRQSFTGWLDRVPFLEAPQVPYEIRVTVRSLASGALIWDADAFLAAELPLDSSAPLPPFAPGTLQNLPAASCFAARSLAARTDGKPLDCAGKYWFHLFPRGPSMAWDTTTVPNGTYELCVMAWDAALNQTHACRQVQVANQ